jgi:hypothetical protein
VTRDGIAVIAAAGDDHSGATRCGFFPGDDLVVELRLFLPGADALGRLTRGVCSSCGRFGSLGSLQGSVPVVVVVGVAVEGCTHILSTRDSPPSAFWVAFWQPLAINQRLLVACPL